MDPVGRRHEVSDLAIGPDGRTMAWTTDSPEREALFVYRARDTLARQVPNPVQAGRRFSTSVVGVLGPRDVIVAERRPGGATMRYARTSGEPARWNGRLLSVMAADSLLGTPNWTPRRELCWARFAVVETAPDWSACYRSGSRTAEVHAMSPSPGGRWLVAVVLDEVVIFDGATGAPTRRVRFEDRVQYAEAEGDDHFLVVLTPSGADDEAAPESWVVRCTLDASCARATQRASALYDTAKFIPE